MHPSQVVLLCVCLLVLAWKINAADMNERANKERAGPANGGNGELQDENVDPATTDEENLREAFSYMDKDGDGLIDGQGVKLAMGYLGIDDSKIERKADELSFEDFKNVINQISTKTVGRSNRKAEGGSDPSNGSKE